MISLIIKIIKYVISLIIKISKYVVIIMISKYVVIIMISKLVAEAQIKPMFVRLTEAERLRIKTLAASQGLAMREAILQAFEVWASQLQSGSRTARPQRRAADTETAARASAGARSDPRRQSGHASADQHAGGAADMPSSDAGPSLGAGSVPGPEALVGDWVSKTKQLDWSKCSAAESVQTKRRNIWVAAGTLVPLTHVFEAIAQDHPLPEIADAYELSVQQLVTLLQFAAEGAARAASG